MTKPYCNKPFPKKSQTKKWIYIMLWKVSLFQHPSHLLGPDGTTITLALKVCPITFAI